MSSSSGVRGGAPKALALFMFLEGKILHLINIPAPNLLKLTSINVIYMQARSQDLEKGGLF